MKRIPFLLLLQTILALVSGFLISKMSWIGRIGISWFMPQYKIFKSWWQTAIVLLLVQLLLIGILALVKKRAAVRTLWICCFALLLTGLTGLYLTYHDFQSTLSHKLMREKFHLGFYIFWLGWIISSLSFLLQLKPARPEAQDRLAL